MSYHARAEGLGKYGKMKEILLEDIRILEVQKWAMAQNQLGTTGLWVKLVPLLFFYKDGFGIESPLKFDLPFDKETKQNHNSPSGSARIHRKRRI